jgi:prepilin-type processing-associated H-X9-DG protein
VVIAIIGILAALLMPAMRSALDSANSASCRNNQRQLVVAFTGYADDNCNFFPPLCIRSKANAWNQWDSSTVVGNYFSNNASLRRCTGVTAIGYNNFDVPYPFYNTNILDYYGTTTYGLWKSPWRPVTKGRNLSKLVVHTDVTSGLNAFGSFSVVAYRHGPMVNVSFVDGHVVATEDPAADYLVGRINVQLK